MTKKEIDTIMDNANTRETKSFLDIQPKEISKFQAFLAIKPILKGKLYWYALRRGYTETDNLYDYRNDIKDAFLSETPSKEYLMIKEEQKHLKSLQAKLTIYRLMTEDEFESKKFGVSWTLKEEIAKNLNDKQSFVNPDTFEMKKIIHRINIKKADVMAFINHRKEFEIIYVHKL